MACFAINIALARRNLSTLGSTVQHGSRYEDPPGVWRWFGVDVGCDRRTITGGEEAPGNEGKQNLPSSEQGKETRHVATF